MLLLFGYLGFVASRIASDFVSSVLIPLTEILLLNKMKIKVKIEYGKRRNGRKSKECHVETNTFERERETLDEEEMREKERDSTRFL